jgi:hypothetical protein
MVKYITGREPRSQPAARSCCRLSDFRSPQLSVLQPPLTRAEHEPEGQLLGCNNKEGESILDRCRSPRRLKRRWIPIVGT